MEMGSILFIIIILLIGFIVVSAIFRLMLNLLKFAVFLLILFGGIFLAIKFVSLFQIYNAIQEHNYILVLETKNDTYGIKVMNESYTILSKDYVESLLETINNKSENSYPVILIKNLPANFSIEDIKALEQNKFELLKKLVFDEIKIYGG